MKSEKKNFVSYQSSQPALNDAEVIECHHLRQKPLALAVLNDLYPMYKASIVAHETGEDEENISHFSLTKVVYSKKSWKVRCVSLIRLENSHLLHFCRKRYKEIWSIEIR